MEKRQSLIDLWGILLIIAACLLYAFIRVTDEKRATEQFRAEVSKQDPGGSERANRAASNHVQVLRGDFTNLTTPVCHPTQWGLYTCLLNGEDRVGNKRNIVLECLASDQPQPCYITRIR